MEPGSTAQIKRAASGFMLEDGAARLVPPFARATRDDDDDALRVTEVEPLIAYIRSARTLDGMNLTDDQLSIVRDHAAAHIAEHGAYPIAKSTGLIVAQRL